jgi:2-polyprenyl-6-methoxyphenol hydroxylase-like FAD-dependent oxidoreductase
MPRWSLGRVTLIGDACHCVSLLAGQGASLAMASAYILADELAKSRSDVAGALAHYERKLRPKIEKKQKAGRRLARWFVPTNRVDLAIRDFVMRMAAWPITSQLLKFTFSHESVI